jgi:HlyD family secretion protein
MPDGAVKIKLYVPEAAFSGIQVGDRLAVSCDGCPAGLMARVSYASPEPEFTPPVIYSLETRQKLSHLIEARPEGEAAALKPGQIVDVRLMADERLTADER